MSIITSFNIPQFAGELFTVDSVNTPLLSMIGGMTGGFVTSNEEFPTSLVYDYPKAKQPEITELEAINAPEGGFVTKEQAKNVVQIFQESIEITYSRKAESQLMKPLSNVEEEYDEVDWHIAQKLKTVARDVEYTFINGKYNKRTGADTPNKARGLIELCTANTLDAQEEEINFDMMDAFYRQMADSGAYLDNMVMFVNSTLKQILTSMYSSQLGGTPMGNRNLGGVNINEIETDFFKCGIVYDKFVPQDTILLVDIAHVAPVFQTVPGKGNFFIEELSKSGASDKYQLYGHIGLGHGPAFLHGAIKNLYV